MGGPSSHLKQLKGLVRKAHLTLPLEHNKVQTVAVEHASRQVEAYLRAYDMEHMPRCDRDSCRASPDGLWCSLPVAFPPRNWQTVLNARGRGMRELEAAKATRRRVRKYVLPEDVMIYQPGSRKRTEDGLDKLALSMMDNVVAIDLQFNAPTSEVGCLQVASSTFALLIRGPKYWQRGLPAALAYLFRDPAVVTLGYEFGEKEQEKLWSSFGWEMTDFSNFIDLQALAAKCGYPSDISLSALSQATMGVKVHVEPDFWETDWEAERLRPIEAFHAGMSVFTIGQIYRQLRHWHALPKKCATCRQELGIFIPSTMQCVVESCGEAFRGEMAHQRHCLETGHPYQSQLCPGCHRIKPVESQLQLSSVQEVGEEAIDVTSGVGWAVQSAQEYQKRRRLDEAYRERLITTKEGLIHGLYGDLADG